MNIRARKRDQLGFSLIEVTIAMAIAAVALVTLLGLIPQGMNTMREAGDQAIQGRIHQQLLNEIQMTPFEDSNGQSLITEYHNVEFFYDGQGEELSDSRESNAPVDRREGSFAHIYSARITFPDQGNAPASVGGAAFSGYSFDDGAINPYVRPVIVEVAAVAGLGENFEWDLLENRHLISTYQSIVVKMGQDYRE